MIVNQSDAASLPKCFGIPDECEACRFCGLKARCWEEQAQEPVFLLPRPRPVQRRRARVESHYVDGDPTMATPEFETAKDFVVPWGKYKGMSLDKIAHTDEGLKYIVEFLASDVIKDNRVRKAAQAYANEPTIWKEYKALSE